MTVNCECPKSILKKAFDKESFLTQAEKVSFAFNTADEFKQIVPRTRKKVRKYELEKADYVKSLIESGLTRKEAEEICKKSKSGRKMDAEPYISSWDRSMQGNEEEMEKLRAREAGAKPEDSPRPETAKVDRPRGQKSKPVGTEDDDEDGGSIEQKLKAHVKDEHEGAEEYDRTAKSSDLASEDRGTLRSHAKDERQHAKENSGILDNYKGREQLEKQKDREEQIEDNKRVEEKVKDYERLLALETRIRDFCSGGLTKTKQAPATADSWGRKKSAAIGKESIDDGRLKKDDDDDDDEDDAGYEGTARGEHLAPKMPTTNPEAHARTGSVDTAQGNRVATAGTVMAGDDGRFKKDEDEDEDEDEDDTEEVSLHKTHTKYEKKPKLGSGARFKQLKRKLAKRGVSSPGGLAAFIGRKKYGKKRFQKLSAKGR